ncbi:MAG: DUF1214 domain-containing protein [Eubacterium sp.]|nr:DUF1214 domain-containing protein [Eubacterium sp.]
MEKLNEGYEKIYNDIYEAYIFAYPLVMTAVYIKHHTNTENIGENRAPFNCIAHNSVQWDDTRTGGPNMDMVYSSAVLDLTDDAILLHKPHSDRFFSVQVSDAYGVCRAIVGTGGLAGNDESWFLLTGPSFTGAIPNGITEVKLTTNHGSLSLRTQLFDPKSPDDLNRLHNIQSNTYLTPLSHYGEKYTPAKGRYNPAYDYNHMAIIKDIPLETYFWIFNKFFYDNPPTPKEREYVKKFEKYNITAGQFSLNCFPIELWEKLRSIPYKVDENVRGIYNQYRVIRNNWIFSPLDASLPDSDIFIKAYTNHWGPGYSPATAAIYATTVMDKDGKKLNSAYRYRIHFKEGMLPPVKSGGYWSISVYTDNDSLYLIKNEIDRYKLGSEDNLEINSDGSLDIYLQHSRPVEHISNWLPIGEYDFRLPLRIYCPTENVISGEWMPPFVERLR